MTEQPKAADDWHPHHGSAKRPKGVGKRDIVNAEPAFHCADNSPASEVNWQHVWRYRIIERASKKEKRRKMWVVESKGQFEVFSDKTTAVLRANDVGGMLYTAKLKDVTE